MDDKPGRRQIIQPISLWLLNGLIIPSLFWRFRKASIILVYLKCRCKLHLIICVYIVGRAFFLQITCHARGIFMKLSLMFCFNGFSIKVTKVFHWKLHEGFACCVISLSIAVASRPILHTYVANIERLLCNTRIGFGIRWILAKILYKSWSRKGPSNHVSVQSCGSIFRLL